MGGREEGGSNVAGRDSDREEVAGGGKERWQREMETKKKETKREEGAQNTLRPSSFHHSR